MTQWEDDFDKGRTLTIKETESVDGGGEPTASVEQLTAIKDEPMGDNSVLEVSDV